MEDDVKYKLDKALNIKSNSYNNKIVPEETKSLTLEDNDSNRGEQVQNDYKKRREVLYDLINKGNEALESSLKVAKGSQHPRNFEVTGQLIKTMADVAKDLTDLQQSMDKLEGESTPNNVTNNNAIFVGSTADLMKALKGDEKVIDG